MERNMQLAKIAIIGFVALLVVGGCSKGSNNITRFGLPYNTARTRLGIPIIPTTWTIQDLGGYLDCFDPNPAQNTPHRLFKRIFIKNGAIVKETDTFYSGKTFYYPPEGSNFPQMVSTEYDYSLAAGSRWKVHADLSAAERSKSIPIEEARQILIAWGLAEGSLLKE